MAVKKKSKIKIKLLWKVIGFTSYVIGEVRADTEKEALKIAHEIWGLHVSHVSRN